MHRYKAQNHLVPNGKNVTTLEQRSSPKSTRCMRGVLWRISHVQELLYILPGRHARERSVLIQMQHRVICTKN